MNHKAIYKLYPNVVTVDDGVGAFDKDGNKVEIDLDLVKDGRDSIFKVDHVLRNETHFLFAETIQDAEYEMDDDNNN